MGRAAGQNSPVNSISLSRGNGTPKQYCTQKKRLTRIFYKRSQGQAALERQMGEHPDFQFTSKNLQAGVRSRHRFGAAMLKRSPWCQDGGRVRIVAFRPGNLETGTSVLQISARGDDPRWSYGPPAVAGSPEAVQKSRFSTFSAFCWMNSRRGSTTSPMSLVKRSSASTMSSTLTCSRVRASGSSVVSQS